MRLTPISKESTEPLRGYKTILLAVTGIAFLSLYFLLSNNNRLVADDFYFLKNLNQLGVWNGMLVAYHSWVTRWFAILFLNVVLKSYTLFHSLLPYHLFTMITFVLVLMKLIRVLATRLLHLEIPLPTLLLYSILFIASFFFFSFNIGETFFWVTSTSMYLWPVIFFIVGLALIISSTGIWDYLFCILCFLFIGGSSESTALSISFLLIAGIIFNYYKCNFSLKSFWSYHSSRMLTVALISLVVSILISYAGHGSELRQSALPDTGILKAIFISLKSEVKFLLFYLPLKIHWFIFFFVPWIYLGHKFAFDTKESLAKVFGTLTRIMIVFFFLSFISFIPISFLLGESGPFRTWILISVFLAVCCAYCGFYLGYKADWNKNLLNRTFSFSVGTLIVLMTINILQQCSITSTYAAAVDQRMDTLMKLKESNSKNTVTLDPLPPSGMLCSSEISGDSSFFSNRHVKNFLELGFDIRKK